MISNYHNGHQVSAPLPQSRKLILTTRIELIMQGVAKFDIAGLQAYSKQHGAPLVLFRPAQNSAMSDPSVFSRCDALAKNLNTKGTVCSFSQFRINRTNNQSIADKR